MCLVSLQVLGVPEAEVRLLAASAASPVSGAQDDSLPTSAGPSLLGAVCCVHGSADALLPLEGSDGGRALHTALRSGFVSPEAAVSANAAREKRTGGEGGRSCELMVLPGASHSFLLERPNDVAAVLERSCREAVQRATMSC